MLKIVAFIPTLKRVESLGGVPKKVGHCDTDPSRTDIKAHQARRLPRRFK